MKILVFGLGALGTVYSCLLKNTGHEITGIDRESVSSIIKEQGVKVTGIWGEHSAHLDRVVSDSADLKGEEFDLIILTVKSYETLEAAGKIKDLMSQNTYLMLAQNGYGNYEAAGRYIDSKNIILGRVIFGAETIEAGGSKVTVIADDVILGSPEKLIDNGVLEDFSRIFSAAGIPTRFSEDVMKYVWGKIIYNSALNPLGAILEVNYGKLAENDESRKLMDGIIEEIFAVLSAIGQETLWPDASSYLQAFYGQMLPPTAEHHASMFQDIQRGRKTEIDALNGAVVKLGRQYGINTPVNSFISSLLKAKESMFS